MMRTTMRFFRAVVALTAVALALSTGLAASTVKWAVRIVPSSGGTVDWATSSPVANGTIRRGGTITFNDGSFVDLTFRAAAGYELLKVTKNGTDWTSFLDPAHHFQFGPVDSPHLFVVAFSPVTPTGTFDLAAPLGSATATQMVDVTGHYAGVTPTSHHRAYDFDAAMDESGKLAVMGSLEGVEPTGGGEIAGSAGSVRTVDGTPTIDARGKFSGTRDGTPVTGTAAFDGPAEITTDGMRQTVGGSLDYNAKAGGVPFADKNVPITADVPSEAAANLAARWSIQVVIRKSTSAKPKTYASGLLVLPNGDRIRFAEKVVKYSPKNGYVLRFMRGTNESRVPNVTDKRSKVTITKMTLQQVALRWNPSGGAIAYAFLGQKGKGNLVEFLSE